MTFYPNEKLAVFIDGANLYAAGKTLDFDIDYKKLLELFKKRGRLTRAYYYTALLEHEDYSPLRPLIDWLDYNGYHVVTKPAKEFVDAIGRKRIKGNMDVEIVVDMMQLSNQVDHVVLFSGDGDFRRVIEVLQHRGVRVSVVSTMKSKPPMTSDELRRQADNFIELTDLEDLIGRARKPSSDDADDEIDEDA